MTTSTLPQTTSTARDSQTNWLTALASMLPLALFAVAVSTEGFPRPWVSVEVAIAAFILGILSSIFLLWKGWITLALIPYSVTPFVLMVMFDEISTAYKTPFIFACTLILIAGGLAYQRFRATSWGWLILLAVVMVTLLLAQQAMMGFWQMTEALGYVRCFPDAAGCPPIPADATPWWRLFLGF